MEHWATGCAYRLHLRLADCGRGCAECSGRLLASTEVSTEAPQRGIPGGAASEMARPRRAKRPWAFRAITPWTGAAWGAYRCARTAPWRACPQYYACAGLSWSCPAGSEAPCGLRAPAFVVARLVPARVRPKLPDMRHVCMAGLYPPSEEQLVGGRHSCWHRAWHAAVVARPSQVSSTRASAWRGAQRQWRRALV